MSYVFPSNSWELPVFPATLGNMSISGLFANLVIPRTGILQMKHYPALYIYIYQLSSWPRLAWLDCKLTEFAKCIAEKDAKHKILSRITCMQVFIMLVLLTTFSKFRFLCKHSIPCPFIRTDQGRSRKYEQNGSHFQITSLNLVPTKS